jgi:MYXO-CTERM domain-containing protein
MTRSRSYVVALLTTTVGLLVASPARAGSWQTNYAFGATLQGDLYTPTTLASSPAIMVAIHYCGGNSGNAHSWFQSYADTAGFYIIAPNAGKNCFDASGSRDGDKAAIVNMVKYLITNKHADATRVFAAGFSSGGCMTNTLLAVYPDVFAGGSALPGFPAGSWPKGDTSCMLCGQGPGSTDGKTLADNMRKVFAWSGQYPCSQQWVGGGDQYMFNAWLPVVAAEVSSLAGLGAGAMVSGKSGWTRTEYKDSNGNVRLQTNLGPSSQRHDLTGAGLFGDVISFLGIDKSSGACGLATTSTTGGGGMSGGATGGAAGAATGGGGGHAGSGMAGGGGHGTGGSGTGGTGTGGTGTGGIVGTGGTGTGGIVSTGGINGTGGTITTGTGGAITTGTGGDTGGGNDAGSAGCACSVRGGSTGAGPVLLLLGLALTFARRVRRRR